MTLNYKIIMLPLFVMFSNFIHPQNVSNYNFTHSNQGSLTNMSMGSVDILVPVDRLSDVVSNIVNIGFDFIFMGKIYNTFSVNSNGLLRLGDERVENTYYNWLQSIYGHPFIAPFWENLNQVTNQNTTQASKVRIKLEGSSPNRVLTIEWKDFVIAYNANTDTAKSTFQVRLYESTNDIEFVYGKMQIAHNSNIVTASIGFSDAPQQGRALGIGNIVTPSIVTNFNQIPNNLVNSNTPGNILGLNSNNDSSRVVYRFSPPNITPNAPTNLVFSNVTSKSLQLSWTGSDFSGVYYYVGITDSLTYNKKFYLPPNMTSFIATGLKENRTYYFTILATNEGRASTPLFGSISTLPLSYEGEYFVGQGIRNPDFQTLTEAISKLSQFGLSGQVVLRVQNNYSSQNETFPIAFTKDLDLSPQKNIIIRPAVEAGNIEISGNINGSIIDFNGCDYLIIDGRASDNDNAIKLTIRNNNQASPVIRFIGSSSFNTIRYCNILGSNKLNINGVILFSNSPQNSRGNSYNLIEFCSIGNSDDFPACGITSTGANSAFNLYNQIRNCNIFNFRPNSTVTIARGIYMHSMGSRWTIEGNNFYQTQPINFSFAGGIVGIEIPMSTYANEIKIINNFIGGSKSLAQGESWKQTGNFNHYFVGIRVSLRDGANFCQSNVIKNINIFTNSSVTTAGIIASRIDLISNVIGDSSSQSSITFYNESKNGSFIALQHSYGKVENNLISGITIKGNGNVSFRGILTNSTSISNNIIGGEIENSILNETNAETIGILINSDITSASEISGNLIRNITSVNIGSQARTFGIFSQSAIPHKILSNVIRNIKSSCLTFNKELVGIAISNTHSNFNLISGNKIFSLYNISTGRPSLYDVTGIYLFCGSGKVEKNFIHSLNIITPNDYDGTIRGIELANGNCNIENNMIRLGIDEYGNNIEKSFNILGIAIGGLLTTANITHNSVCITGYVNRDYFSRTAALVRNNNFNISVFNNIFFNSRFNGIGNSEHYCILSTSSEAITSNYNLFYVSELNGIIGSLDNGNSKHYSLSSWSNSTNLDTNSIFGYPNFLNYLGNKDSVDLHIKSPSPVEGKGWFIATTPEDFDSELRSNLTPVDIGADAGNFIFGFPISADENTDLITIKDFYLYQNHPNPFNPSTTISWQSAVGSKQTIKLYNALGEEIDTIVDGYYEAGKHSIFYIVNSTLPSGVYFYQLRAGDYVQTKKMILMR